jgi:DNA polymerase-1
MICTEQRLVTTMSEAMEVLERMKSAPVWTYDSETSGLDWRKNHVVGYVIKPIGHPSFYIPVRHLGGGNIPGCRVPATADGWKGDLHPFEIELAKVARDSQSKRIVGHYLDFDLKFSYRHGIMFTGDLEDTMINAALLDENMRGFSLENVAAWCEAIAKKGQDLYVYLSTNFGGPAERKSMEHFWKTPGDEPVVWDYAAGDGVSTEDVWAKQNKYIVEEGLERVHAVENRVIRTIFRMTHRGIRIDEDELDRVDQQFRQRAAQLHGKFPDWFTKTNAPTQMKRLLEDHIKRLGSAWPRTAKGALQFNEAILKTIPEGRDVLEVRKMEHAVSAFTGPMKEEHLWKGKVFCSFNQMKADEYGTVSGRLSSSNPNLQQVPKRDKNVGKPYRRCFLPDEGHIWWDRDYKQQEYVIFTDYVRDPNLMAGYSAEPPVDIHQVVAEMLGVERDPTAKRMNLGMLYGMGVPTLSGHLGVEVSQAREWQNLYHERFPYSKNFLKSAEVRARQRGFVFTYLGRKRRFPDTRGAHKAGNAVIQGSSADVTKLKMAEIDEFFASEGDYARLILQCHDSLSWTAPDDDRGRKLSAEADRIMQDFSSESALIKLGIPLRIDASTGKNWSEATFGA